MLVNIQRVKLYLFFIILFALPFNSLPIYKLGQLSHEGSFPSLLIFVLLFLFQSIYIITINKKIVIQNRILTSLIIIFCIYAVYILFFNYSEISENDYMDKLGVRRFVFQYIQLIFGFFIMYAIASTIYYKEQFYVVVKIISLVVALFISFAILQLLAYSIQDVFLDVYRVIGEKIYPEGLIDWALVRRHALHSVTQEPSFLSMYLSVMAPFVIARSIAKRKYILFLLVTLVIIMSKSRTGYVIYTFELLLFLYFLKFHVVKLKYLLYMCFFLLIFIPVLFMTPLSEIFFSLFDLENSSNAARYGASYSSLLVWWNSNIFFGVGLGQTGFSSVQYLPDWGHLTGDIIATVNEERWPPIHNMLVRILVETGIVGLALFISIYMYILYKSYKVVSFKYIKQGEVDLLGYAVIISLIASFLILFNRELFSNFNIWITWGLALSYININQRKIKYVKTI